MRDVVVRRLIDPLVDGLYLSNVFALHLRPLYLPFISKDGEQRIGHDLGQAETPDESDGVEKVGVA